MSLLNHKKILFIMFVLSIYIIVHALATNAQGQPQNCIDFCDPLFNQPGSLVPKVLQRKCNCEQTLAVIPLATDVSLETKDIHHPNKHDLVYQSQFEANKLQKLNVEAVTDENVVNSSSDTFSFNNKHDIANSKRAKRNAETFLNGTGENAKEYPLYLDVDLHTPKDDNNSNLKRDLIDMFDNLRESEKYLSECINLHIYIFSKDNNILEKTHIKHDNLTNSELLTEIHNKCDQPATIIRESIFQIKHGKRKGSNATQKYLKDTDNIKVAEKEKSSSEEITTTTDYNPYDFTLNTVSTATATDLIDVEKVNKHGIETQSLNKVGQSEEIQKISTLKVIHPTHNFRRNEILEEDILLTEIIIKELDNGTIINSVTERFELVTEIDFRKDNIISETENYNTVSDKDNLAEFQLDEKDHTQSNVSTDIEGNLFFSFDQNQLPVRFIQNSEGQMHLALDGFSLCKQIASRRDNKLVFMNILCSCIQHHNCSYTPP